LLQIAADAAAAAAGAHPRTAHNAATVAHCAAALLALRAPSPLALTALSAL
jgi:hypothetical protein